MKKAFALIFTVVLIFGLSAQNTVVFTEFFDKENNPIPQPEGEYDIYLLIGQSNMAGRGYILDSDTQYEMPGVWLLNNEGVPVPAKNPINQYSSVRKGMSVQRISPGTMFGVTVAEHTGRKVLLVSNALGGSNITAWLKTSGKITDTGSIGYNTLQLYSEAIRRTRQAMEHGKLKGIIWHQGEANRAQNARAAYPGQFRTLIADIRADLNAPEVPVVVGELAYWNENQVLFNEMLRNLVKDGTISNIDYISADLENEDVPNNGMLVNADDPHFNRDAQLIIGKRYAAKILKMIYGITETSK